MSVTEETGRVKVPVTGEMWTAIHAPGCDPPRELGERGLNVLRMDYGCEEDEIAYIREDGVYAESCRTAYWEAKRGFDRHRKLPRKLTLTFSRPGTRREGMKPRPDEESEE